MADELVKDPTSLFVVADLQGVAEFTTFSKKVADDFAAKGHEVAEYRRAPAVASVSAPSGAVDSEASRAKFEATIAIGRDGLPLCFDRGETGEYLSDVTRDAWFCWQAGRGWVDFADYAALLAERDALAAQVEAIGKERDALSDMLDDSRCQFGMVRTALGVSYEPHQSSFERTLDAARQETTRAPE